PRRHRLRRGRHQLGPADGGDGGAVRARPGRRRRRRVVAGAPHARARPRTGAGAAVKLAVVAWHRPEPEGTPTGRCLYAFVEGALAEGHAVSVWSWTRHPPPGPLPDWCEWRPLPPEAAWKTRARALVRPRHDIVRAGWRLPEGTVGLADE